MSKMYCALCHDSKSVEFSLKLNSKHSHTPLLLLIEKVGAFVSLHYNICLQCYELLNELDAIQQRQIEIHNQLMKYILLKKEIKEKDVGISVINTGGVDDVYGINTLITDGDNNIDKTRLKNELLIAEEVPHLNYLSNNDPHINNSFNIKLEYENEVKFDGELKRKHYVPKPYKCHCSKEFRTMRELKSHTNSHNNYRPFICDICGMSYKCNRVFSRHMDMHKGINPFTCIYCNKSFTQKIALARHVRIHTGEKPYQCDECGKTFIHHTSFNTHRLSHTGQKSYKCSICGLALISGSHLKRHMRIHTGEKNFSCKICGRRFAERYNLVAHEKLHNNPKSNISISFNSNTMSSKNERKCLNTVKNKPK